MTNNDNVSGLCERLRGVESETYALGFLHVTYVNPDGPEAADTLERQAAEIERLQEVVDELIKLDTGPKIRLRRSGPTDIRIEAPTGEDT
jgi:hypothetical protein